MRIERPEGREADALDLDQATVRVLDEVDLALVAFIGASRGEHDREQGGDERPPYYNVQEVLSARQRRVRRRTGSMMSLSTATMISSITTPHDIIPVKLPASYQ